MTSPSKRSRTTEQRAKSAAGQPEADPEQVARAIVLRQLTLQPRTRAELARALTRRGVPDDVIDTVLGRFSEVGLIDDAAFARAWVESRHAGRGLARRALAHELRRRGVADDEAREAVESLTPETEAATARALVLRRLRTLRGVDGPTRVRRLVGMLARKGYPPRVALQVVREVLGESTDEAERGAVDEFSAAVDTMDDASELGGH